MKRSNLLSLFLIVLIAGSVFGYLAYQKVAKPEAVTGAWRVKEANVRVEDGQVKGYWMFSLSVNTRDEIEFTISDLTKDVKANLKEDIPPGTEIRTGAKVSAIFKPDGPPYISGPVTRMGYVYDDKGSEDGGWHRIWQFYALGYPEWHADGRHAPYRIKIEKDGSAVYGPKTFISGIRPGWDDGRIIDLPYGMQVKQFAQLTNGLVLPTNKYAYTWIQPKGEPEQTYTELKKLSELRGRLRAGYQNTTMVGPFQDEIDCWDEVSSEADVSGSDWEPTVRDLASYSGILSEFLKGIYMPADKKRFSEGAPSLYSNKVPHDTDTVWGSQPDDTFVTDPTQMVAVRALPEASVTASLLFKVPADFFDAWVYKPPYGIPKIVGKNFPTAVDGQRNIVSVDVRNTGPTGDTFTGDLTFDDPKITIDEGPGRVYIDADSTKTLQWVVSRPATSREEYEVGWSVDVRARESGESTSKSGTQTWKGGAGGPPQGYGSVTGEVKDSKGFRLEMRRSRSAGGRTSRTRTGSSRSPG